MAAVGTRTTKLPSSGIEGGPGGVLNASGAVSAKGRRRRNRWSWSVIGVLAVAGSVLGFLVLNEALDERSPVLVAGRDIEAGAVITVEDVTVVPVGVGPGVELVERSQQDLVIGQRAGTRIAVGTPLSLSLIAVEDGVGPGESVVGAVLEAGEYPTSAMSVGDSVLLVSVPSISGGDEAPVEIGPARVWAIEALAEQAEPRFFVSLLVTDELQLAVAGAAGQDRLRVLLVDEE